MPRLSDTAVPAYCHHRGSGQAVVTLNGRDFYLGKHAKRMFDIVREIGGGIDFDPTPHFARVMQGYGVSRSQAVSMAKNFLLLEQKPNPAYVKNGKNSFAKGAIVPGHDPIGTGGEQPGTASAKRENARPRPPAANTVLDEPVARDALARIGTDPSADDVWIAAINDASFTPSQRRNLIEDLNETGFADPRNLTPDDLPMIEYRMVLIEQIAENAMDDVNAGAFEEAYRDLTNMRRRVSQQ